MANVPTVVVGTGNQRKVVSPALLTGIDSTGAIVPLKVDSSGKLMISGGSTLTGNGDPNNNGTVGTNGAMYQDLQNGILYVYGSNNNGLDSWSPVLTNTNSAQPFSEDAQIFTNFQGSGPQWSYAIESSIGTIMQWSQSTGAVMLSLSDNFAAASFESRTLNAGEEIVYNWGTNVIYDWVQATRSVDFNNRLICAQNDDITIDYSSFPLKIVAPVGSGPALYNGSLTNTSAPVCGFNTQTFTPTTGQTVTVATTSGNNILIAVTGSGTLATLTIALANMLNNQPSTEAIIYIHSSRTITLLTLTYSGYTFSGTAITTLAANSTHVLRRSGTVLYHVQ